MSKPSRKIFVVISALAVMAVSLFLIASTLYSPPIPSIPVQPTVIVFEPDSVEMGELSPDVAKTVVIRLRNVSDHPLLITTAVASCGCTTSTWPTDPIAPGEFAEAGVTVKPSKEQAGETLMKTVTYLVEDVGPVTVFVRGHVATLPSSETAAPLPPSGAAVGSATATAIAKTPTIDSERIFKLLKMKPGCMHEIAGRELPTGHVRPKLPERAEISQTTFDIDAGSSMGGRFSAATRSDITSNAMPSRPSHSARSNACQSSRGRSRHSSNSR